MKGKKTRVLKIIVIAIVITTALFLTTSITLTKFIYPLKYFDIIKEEASKNNLDPYLVIAIVKTESGFNQYANSNKKAKGLMQIIDTTAREINKQINISDNSNLNLYDKKINIAIGCKYFNNLVEKYEGNYYLAICAYNAGMGNVDKWIEQGIINSKLNDYKEIALPFNETEKYLKKVLVSYEMYKKIYN